MGEFVNQIIPVITLPIITRFLSAGDFGVYAMSQVYANFFVALAFCGLTVIFERNYFQEKSEEERVVLLNSLVVFTLMVSLILTLVLSLFGGFLANHLLKDSNLAWMLHISFFTTFLTNLRLFFIVYFRNSTDAANSIKLVILGTIVSYAVILLLLVFFNLGLRGYLFGFLVGQIVATVPIAVKFLRNGKYVIELKKVFQLLKISFPLFPRIIMGIINTQFDKYMLGIMAQMGAVGIFTMGYKFSYVIFIFMNALGNAFVPQTYKMMFESSSKEQRAKIGEMLTPFFYVSAFIATTIVLWAKEILFLFTTQEFYDAERIVIMLSCFYILLFFGKQNQLIWAKKTMLISALTIIQVVFNILLNLFLIPRYGAIGAAWATFSAGVIYACTAFCFSQKAYNILFEYKKIFFALLFVFGSALISYSNLLKGVSFFSISIKALIMLAFIAMVFWQKIVTKKMLIENWEKINKSFKASKL